ncbi:STM4014 family protein, partial [Myxococcota bacterium]|nr:STM4014 family protein [Myxococcota bacterium]
KLAFGSSASGVVALAIARSRGGVRVVAHTSVELVRAGTDVRLYNSLRVRRYDDERDAATIVDHLAREGVHVEVWIPKAGIEGHTFDLRVVVIAGRARHVIARLGRGPMTNLHLGNQRAPAELVRAAFGEERWATWMRTAEAAAAVFPRTHHVGVDLLVHATRPDAHVAEVNAFGDLLPNVLDRGLDTYGAEVEALVAAHGGVAPPAPER